MNAYGNTFSATSRSSLVSRARYTSPMPPSPILAVTEYGPRAVPGDRGMATGSAKGLADAWHVRRTKKAGATLPIARHVRAFLNDQLRGSDLVS